MAKQYWQNGLKFKCKRCGNCCKGLPGNIYFSPAEVAAALENQNKDLKQVELVDFSTAASGYVLSTNFETGLCPFYHNGCSIYEHRPQQCRAFPFWRHVLQDKRLWLDHAKDCPGINAEDAELISPEKIVQIASLSPI